MDRRLQQRYWTLVSSHMKAANSTCAAMSKLPKNEASAFAATQATWRFLNNERVSLHDLMVPIRQAALRATQDSHSAYMLAVHDWSKICCGNHTSKQDLAQLTHKTDIGYELYSCLMVDGDTGVSVAPMEFRLETGTEIHHTQEPELIQEQWHIDQVAGVMKSARGWGIKQKIVHVIDQEADSIAHYRKWASEGELFLVRSEDRSVLWRGKPRRFSSIVRTLLQEDAFMQAHTILFRGVEHELRIASSDVILHRPAQPRKEGKQIYVSGEPLPVRLVVSRVYDEKNRKKAEWYLLTNVDSSVSATQIANWYYWRWRIESFFKLLKSSGFQIEHWQQSSGAAIARRLLIAAMACVYIWQLERDASPQAIEMKDLLVQLSGRQMKRKRLHTAPAMLAGLEKLLTMFAILETHSIDNIRRLAKTVLPAQLLNSS